MKVNRNWLGFTTFEDDSKVVKLPDNIANEIYKMYSLMCKDGENIKKCSKETDNFMIKAEKEECGVIITIKQQVFKKYDGLLSPIKSMKYDIIFIHEFDSDNFIKEFKKYITL